MTAKISALKVRLTVQRVIIAVVTAHNVQGVVGNGSRQIGSIKNKVIKCTV